MEAIESEDGTPQICVETRIYSGRGGYDARLLGRGLGTSQSI